MGTQKETWHQRLDIAIKTRKKKQKEVAKAAGVSDASVSDWISGKTHNIEGQNLTRVCGFLRINPEWLMNRRLPSGLEDADQEFTPEEDYGVPVVGNVRGGRDVYYLELEHVVGQGEGLIRYPTKDPNTYALRVKGDSMRPRIKPGEFIVVEPNHSIAIGEEVMVKTMKDEAMVKVLSRRSNGEVEFRSINEVDHPPFTLDEKDVKEMHYIGAIVKPSWYYERS